MERRVRGNLHARCEAGGATRSSLIAQILVQKTATLVIKGIPNQNCVRSNSEVGCMR